jgi:hypothetical protein
MLLLQLQEIPNILASVATSWRPAISDAQAESVLARAVLSAAERLGLRHRQLAAVLGTSEASISRLQNSRGLAPASKEGELALLFLRLYRSLDALVGGDDDKAREWLHAQNDQLRGVPAERIRTVEGLVDVVQYLDAMRGRL